MTKAIDAQSKPAVRSDVADQQALVQVEKWMAVIRDISRAASTDSKLRG